jgi:hypothetical protein
VRYRGCNSASTHVVRLIAGLAATAIVTVTLPATPAAAAGFLDYIFGGFRRPPPPPPPPAQVNTPSDFFHSLFDEPRRSESVRSSSSGGSGAFCVRMCDGRYYPIQSYRNASTAEQCHATCPNAETRVFSGGAIDHAVASEGTHYSDIPNAFVYRQHVVSSCTCNGKTNYGLVHEPLANDPTLRPGDIVTTNSGFTVYKGGNPGQTASYTPIDSANVSKSLRAQLADTKVTPRPAGAETTGQAPPDTTSSIRGDRRHLSARGR